MSTTESRSVDFSGNAFPSFFKQDGSVFAGLLDDLGVFFNGLLGDVMLLLPVHVAEVNDLVEDAAGGARDGGFVDRAVLERFRHFFGIELCRRIR